MASFCCTCGNSFRLEGYGPREQYLLGSLHIEKLEERLDNNVLDANKLSTSVVEEGRLVYRCEKCLRLFVYETLKGKEFLLAYEPTELLKAGYDDPEPPLLQEMLKD